MGQYLEKMADVKFRVLSFVLQRRCYIRIITVFTRQMHPFHEANLAFSPAEQCSDSHPHSLGILLFGGHLHFHINTGFSMDFTTYLSGFKT